MSLAHEEIWQRGHGPGNDARARNEPRWQEGVGVQGVAQAGERSEWVVNGHGDDDVGNSGRKWPQAPFWQWDGHVDLHRDVFPGQENGRIGTKHREDGHNVYRVQVGGGREGGREGVPIDEQIESFSYLVGFLFFHERAAHG